MTNADYRLYLVTDERRDPAPAVREAVLGGCTMVQLRGDARAAHAVKAVTDALGVPLIVNDSASLALELDAAGLHVGQNDLPAREARRRIGRDKLLGVSVTTAEQAVAAQCDGADYLGVGAMFPTPTKPDAALVAMDELRRIRRAVSLPIVVIGGISPATLPLFRGMGADGAAVVSAILSAPDVRAAARELRRLCTELFPPHPA